MRDEVNKMAHFNLVFIWDEHLYQYFRFGASDLIFQALLYRNI